MGAIFTLKVVRSDHEEDVHSLGEVLQGSHSISHSILFEAKDDAAGISIEKNGVKEWLPFVVTNYGKDLTVEELERFKRIVYAVGWNQFSTSFNSSILWVPVNTSLVIMWLRQRSWGCTNWKCLTFSALCSFFAYFDYFFLFRKVFHFHGDLQPCFIVYGKSFRYSKLTRLSLNKAFIKARLL